MNKYSIFFIGGLIISNTHAGEVIHLESLTVESAFTNGANQQDFNPEGPIFSRQGNSIYLSNNEWKSLVLTEPIQITDNTVLSFEFRVEGTPEIAAINLSNENTVHQNTNQRYYTLSSAQNLNQFYIQSASYQANGVQGPFDIGGGWQRFSIKLHHNYGTGTSFDRIHFVCDDDRNNVAELGAASFRNLRFYEDTGAETNFSTVEVNEDLWVNGNVNIEGDIKIQVQGDISMGDFGE